MQACKILSPLRYRIRGGCNNLLLMKRLASGKLLLPYRVGFHKFRLVPITIETLFYQVLELGTRPFLWVKSIRVHSFYRQIRIFRSEERRVGKECRSRWSP